LITTRHKHKHSQNRFAVIPTPLRLNADLKATGDGITIAFLDSGFYPHPDLTEPANRIVAYHDVTQPNAVLDEQRVPENWDWHGTMTSVSAVGNGYLSAGIYCGLACESKVVLVKVSRSGQISEENIALGLRWVIDHKDLYNIRVVSISLGGDEDVPFMDNIVDRLAEEAVDKGLVVVVAAGNSGCMERHHTVPPANSPSVITVGGYDDQNQFENSNRHLYCSSYGSTADGILKPEILAPAIWIAAPILPFTNAFQMAEALTELYEAPDYELPALLRKKNKILEVPESLAASRPDAIRAEVEFLLREKKIISSHYQHVDGTSFAAPIVASVVAQMLQMNPELTAGAVKNILISTAERIRNAPVIRQGYGMLNAGAAVEQARQENHSLENKHFLPPRVESNKLIFFYHNDSAENVELVGEFSKWTSFTNFKKENTGIWRAEIDLPRPGRYRYKFIINGNQWVDDPANGLKEADEYGGFNSIVNVT
jgi:serine protease AprX